MKTFDVRRKNEYRYLILLGVILTVSVLVIYSRFFFGDYRYVFHNTNNDTANQYIPSIMSTVQKMKEGDFSFWDITMGYGLDITNSTSWVFDPFNIPVYIAGVFSGINGVLAAIAVMQALKSVLTGLFAWLLEGEFGFWGLPRVAGAYAIAFCGYIMVWGEHYFFASACVFFTILIWRIERCINTDKGYWILAVVTAITLIFSLYISIMIAVGCAIYLVFRVISTGQRQGGKQALKRFWRICLAVIIAVLLSMCITLPAFYQLTQVTSRLSGKGSVINNVRAAAKSWTGRERMVELFLRMVSNNLYGSQDYYQGRKLSYVETIQLSFSCLWTTFLAVFFAEKIGHEKGKRLQSLILCGGFVFSLVYPLTGMVFNAFENPNTRYAFVYIPFATYVISWVLTKVRNLHISSLAAGWLMAVFTVLVMRRWHMVLNKHHMNFYAHVLYAAIGISILIITIINQRLHVLIKQRVNINKINRKTSLIKLTKIGEAGGFCILISVVILSTAADAWYSLNYQNPWTRGEIQEAAAAENQINGTLSTLKASNKDFFRIEKTYADLSTWNDSLFEDYAGCSYYNTTYNRYISQFIEDYWPETEYAPSLGTKYVVYRNDARNSMMGDLTGVRFIFADSNTGMNSADFAETADLGNGVKLYRNVSDTGFGTLYSTAVSEEYLRELDPHERQNVLSQNVILSDQDIKDNRLHTAEISSSINKTDQVDVFKDSDDGIFTADVNADQTRIFLLPVAYDKGWKASLDGKGTRILCADEGFQAVIVPEGEHHISFTYSTPLLREGIIASILGLIGGAAILIVKRRTKRSFYEKKEKHSGRDI